MAEYADVPQPTVDLAAQGSIAPPGGKVAVHVKTPYGNQVVYVPQGMQQEDIISAINSQVIPHLAQQQNENTQKAAWQNAAIPIDTPFGRITVPPEIGSQIIGWGHGTSTFLNGIRQAVLGRDPQQDAEIAAGNKAFAPLAQQSLGARIADVGGQAAPWVAASSAFPALAPEAAAAATATPAASMANAGLQSALQGATQYVPPGGSRIANTVDAAKQGLLFQAPFSAAQKVAAGPKNVLSAPQQQAVEDMSSIPGYKPLPSQITGNPTLGNVEQLMGYFPFSGPQIAERNATNRAAINQPILEAIGAPEGTQFGTQDVLAKIKKGALDTINEAKAVTTPVQISPDGQSTLKAIRDAALNTNTPPTKTISTLNKIVGDASDQLVPALSNVSDTVRDMAVRKYGLGAFQSIHLPGEMAPSASTFANGIPMPYAQSIVSDLSDWAQKGDPFAGQANTILRNEIGNSLGPDLGPRYTEANQIYSALTTSESAIDPATGLVNPRSLSANLSNSGGNVLAYGESSNPRLEQLADLANSARGTPPPPAEGSPTAQRMAWMKFLGLIPEGAAAAGGAYATHAATGGDLALSALAAGVPFAAANYATKAYLSPAFAQWAQQGIPTLGQLASSLAPIGGAVVPAVAAATTSP